MANPAINLSYIGNGPTGSYQVIADQTSGPKAKTLYAYGNLVASSGTFTSTTAATVNFIDGVQTLGKAIVLNFASVAAPVTYLGTANQAFYLTAQSAGQLAVNESITFAGFSNSGNNGTFTINTVLPNGVYVTNSSAVAETNPAATGIVNVSNIPVWVDVFVAGSNGDSTGAAAAAGLIRPFGVTATSFQLSYSSLATTGASVGLGFIIAFSS